MGYTITIGELTAEVSDEWVRLGARGVSLPDAPAFGEPTDHENQRWPSYTGWADFCRDAGIEELFYGMGWSGPERRYAECSEGFHREVPLLREHPGAFPITVKDADYVSAAKAAFMAANPGKVAGFPMDDYGDIIEGKEAYSATLARLEWLDFWMRWAVENCEKPVVANS